MTYIPKVGDRVTVAGDDREWEVLCVNDDGTVEIECHTSSSLLVLPSMLTPVPTVDFSSGIDDTDVTLEEVLAACAEARKYVAERRKPAPPPEPPWRPDFLDADEANGTQGRLSSAVHQAIGTGSVCWTEEPRGVFDDKTARWVAEGLLAYINSVLIDPADGAQRRDAGLCRVDEVADFLPWIGSEWRAKFYDRFGGGSDE